MTIADTIEAHQARCQPHLLTLRMIAHDEADPVLTRRAVIEIVQATRAILAEAETAARAVGVSADGPGAAVLVQVRLNRLAASAEDAVLGGWVGRLRADAVSSAQVRYADRRDLDGAAGRLRRPGTRPFGGLKGELRLYRGFARDHCPEVAD